MGASLGCGHFLSFLQWRSKNKLHSQSLHSLPTVLKNKQFKQRANRTVAKHMHRKQTNKQQQQQQKNLIKNTLGTRCVLLLWKIRNTDSIVKNVTKKNRENSSVMQYSQDTVGLKLKLLVLHKFSAVCLGLYALLFVMHWI